jgi:hypothetical protein
MSNQQCHKLHEMTPSPMNLQPQACAVCSEQFMPNYQTLTCTQCNESLCLECVLLYSPETAFPMYLAKHSDPCALQHYNNHRDSAIRLMRDPYLAQVYHEYQRFYNTDAYHQLLEARIANTKHELNCLKAEIDRTQSRLVTAKLELMHAQQRRRSAFEENPRKIEAGLA